MISVWQASLDGVLAERVRREAAADRRWDAICRADRERIARDLGPPLTEEQWAEQTAALFRSMVEDDTLTLTAAETAGDRWLDATLAAVRQRELQR